MNIQKITLKDLEIVEVDGEYKKAYKNEKSYPAFLTNYALKNGKDQGLIESSLFSDLLKLQGLEKLSSSQAAIDPAVFENIDESKMMQIIYLAFKGANKNSELSLDGFLQKYHATFDETLELYMNLIMDLMAKDPNQFAAGLKKSTNKSRNKGKKHYHQR